MERGCRRREAPRWLYGALPSFCGRQRDAGVVGSSPLAAVAAFLWLCWVLSLLDRGLLWPRPRTAGPMLSGGSCGPAPDPGGRTQSGLRTRSPWPSASGYPPLSGDQAVAAYERLGGRYVRLASRRTATSPGRGTMINPPSPPSSGPAILFDQTSLTARLMGPGSERNNRDLGYRTNVLEESKGRLRCDEGETVSVGRARSRSMVLVR